MKFRHLAICRRSEGKGWGGGKGGGGCKGPPRTSQGPKGPWRGVAPSGHWTSGPTEPVGGGSSWITESVASLTWDCVHHYVNILEIALYRFFRRHSGDIWETFVNWFLLIDIWTVSRTKAKPGEPIFLPQKCPQSWQKCCFWPILAL